MYTVEDKTKKMTVKFIDDAKYMVGFFEDDACIMATPLDTLDGYNDNLYDILKDGGEHTIYLTMVNPAE